MPDQPSPARQLIGDFAPKLPALTDDVLFEDVWERPELSDRDRNLVTIAALIALDPDPATARPPRPRRRQRRHPGRTHRSDHPPSRSIPAGPPPSAPSPSPRSSSSRADHGTLDRTEDRRAVLHRPGTVRRDVAVDMGADVILVDRPDEPNLGYPDHRYRFLYRNRRSVQVDLKTPNGVEAVLSLVEQADGVIEGFRPGVAERLGLGPEVCLEHNPKLVYGRMTGLRADRSAGRSGRIRRQLPLPHRRVVGDRRGRPAAGAAAHPGRRFRRGRRVPRPRHGVGDVGGRPLGHWSGGRRRHRRRRAEPHGVRVRQPAGRHLDCPNVSPTSSTAATGATASTAARDGRFLSLAILQPKFLRAFLAKAGVDLPAEWATTTTAANWPALPGVDGRRDRQPDTRRMGRPVRDDDDCVPPVLDLAEAPVAPPPHGPPGLREVDGTRQPAPAPRFSRTPSEVTRRARTRARAAPTGPAATGGSPPTRSLASGW